MSTIPPVQCLLFVIVKEVKKERCAFSYLHYAITYIYIPIFYYSNVGRKVSFLSIHNFLWNSWKWSKRKNIFQRELTAYKK